MGGRLGGWVKKVKVRLRRKKEAHRHRQRQYGDCQRKKGMGEVKEGKAGINGGGKRLYFG